MTSKNLSKLYSLQEGCELTFSRIFKDLQKAQFTKSYKMADSEDISLDFIEQQLECLYSLVEKVLTSYTDKHFAINFRSHQKHIIIDCYHHGLSQALKAMNCEAKELILEITQMSQKLHVWTEIIFDYDQEIPSLCVSFYPFQKPD